MKALSGNIVLVPWRVVLGKYCWSLLPPLQMTAFQSFRDIILLHGFTTLQGMLPVIHEDDVMKWKNFPHYWSFVRGIHRAVTRRFDVFFYLRLNKRLSKQSWGRWFQTSSHPLWRHCNVLIDWWGTKRHRGIEIYIEFMLTGEIILRSQVRRNEKKI